MFKYLLLVALISVITAIDDDVHAEVKSAYSKDDGHGHFKYGHDISNGIEANVEGDGNVIHGEYYLLNEHGEKIKVTYTADSTGFHPESSLLPVAPGVPV